MGSRVDLVRVTMDVYEEFEGRRQVQFSFCPASVFDQELLDMLWKKHDALNAANVAAAGPIQDIFLM